MRREFATPNGHDVIFATRNGTWHQVVNIERRWRQIRKDTGYERVTTFRKTVATLISEATSSELASRRLGHSSSQVTRDHYIAKPRFRPIYLSSSNGSLRATIRDRIRRSPHRLRLVNDHSAVPRQNQNRL